MSPPKHSDPPFVLLQRPFEFERQRLAEVLEASDYEARELGEGETIEKVLSELERPPDLMILQLGNQQDDATTPLIELRKNKRAGRISILGVTRFDQMELDIPELRSLGVVGLVDERADCQTSLRRIRQVFGTGRPGRRADRVRCFLPVQVHRETLHLEEFALDLSTTGMRLTVSEPLEPNIDIDLAFKLPNLSQETLELTARIIHRGDVPNSAGRWEMGVFFYPMSDACAALIEAEITRLLQA